ncbi:MFS transporter [Marinomonas agarivorans]|nr:MFS transporter [Marinomonas agarivorans]
MSNDIKLNENTVKENNWVDIIVLWFVGIFAAMQFSKFSISYDNLLVEYSTSGASIGTLLSIIGVVGLLCGVVAGVVSGHLGYQKVLIGSLCIGGAMSLLQSTLPSYPILLISRVVEGISHLGIVVAAPTLMLRNSTTNSQSLIMGLWGTFFGVAFAITGWGGEILLSLYGSSGLFLSHAIISLPLVAYFLLFLQKDSSTPSTISKLHIEKLFSLTLKVYLTPRTCLPGIVFLFHTSMFVALLTFVPKISADNSTKNLLLVLLPLFSIIGTFLSGPLSQYFLRPPNLLIVAYTSVALSTFLVTLFEGEQQLFLYSSLFLLLMSGVVQGTSFTLIPFLSKDESEQAMGNGAIAQLGNLGATVGPPMFAYCIESNGTEGLFIIVTCLCFFGCITGLISRRY